MNNNNKGITLVEVLLATALIGIILALGYAIFHFGNKSFNVQNEQAAAVANARYTMDYLIREVRKAELVEVDEDQKVLKVDGVDIKLVDNTLMDGDDVVSTGIHDLIISLDNSELQIEVVIQNHGLPEYKLNSSVFLRQGG